MLESLTFNIHYRNALAGDPCARWTLAHLANSEGVTIEINKFVQKARQGSIKDEDKSILDSLPETITPDNVMTNIKALKDLGALPQAQIFSTGERVNNNTIDWSTWTGCVFVDVDSKVYLDSPSATHKELFSACFDEIVEAIQRNITVIHENLLAMQVSASGTSFHLFLFFNGINKTEADYRRAVAYAETVTRGVLTISVPAAIGGGVLNGDPAAVKAMMAEVVATPGVIDAAAFRPAQPLYITPAPFFINPSAGDLTNYLKFVPGSEIQVTAEPTAKNVDWVMVGKPEALVGTPTIPGDTGHAFRIHLSAALIAVFGADAQKVFERDWLAVACAKSTRRQSEVLRVMKGIISYDLRKHKAPYPSTAYLRMMEDAYGVQFMRKGDAKPENIKVIEAIITAARRVPLYNTQERLPDNLYITDRIGALRSALSRTNVYLNAACGTGKSYLVKTMLKTEERCIVVTPLKSVKQSVYEADLAREGFVDYASLDQHQAKALQAQADPSLLPRRIICGWEQLAVISDLVEQQGEYTILIDESHLLIEQDFRDKDTVAPRSSVLRLCTRLRRGVMMLTGTPLGEHTFLSAGYEGFCYWKDYKDIRYEIHSYNTEKHKADKKTPRRPHDARYILGLIEGVRLANDGERICVYSNSNFNKIEGELPDAEWVKYRNTDGSVCKAGMRSDMKALNESHILHKQNLLMTSYFSVGCEVKHDKADPSTKITDITVIIDASQGGIAYAGVTQAINRFRDAKRVRCIIYLGAESAAGSGSLARYLEAFNAKGAFRAKGTPLLTEQLSTNAFLAPTNHLRSAGAGSAATDAFNLLVDAVTVRGRQEIITSPEAFRAQFTPGAQGCVSITETDALTYKPQSKEERQFYRQFWIGDHFRIDNNGAFYKALSEACREKVSPDKQRALAAVLRAGDGAACAEGDDPWLLHRCHLIQRAVRQWGAAASLIAEARMDAGAPAIAPERMGDAVKLLMSRGSVSPDRDVARDIRDLYRIKNSVAYSEATKSKWVDSLCRLGGIAEDYGVFAMPEKPAAALSAEKFGGGVPDGFNADEWNIILQGEAVENPDSDPARLLPFYNYYQAKLPAIRACYAFLCGPTMTVFNIGLSAWLDRWLGKMDEVRARGAEPDHHFFEERGAKGEAVGKAVGEALNEKWWLKSDHAVRFKTKEEMYEHWRENFGGTGSFNYFTNNKWKEAYEKMTKS